MEKSIEHIDFEIIDQAVQVHGKFALLLFSAIRAEGNVSDYLGVSMSSRTPEAKQAASQASKIFGDYYPELLVRSSFLTFIFRSQLSLASTATIHMSCKTLADPSPPVQEVLHQRPHPHVLHFLDLQGDLAREDVCEDERCGHEHEQHSGYARRDY